MVHGQENSRLQWKRGLGKGWIEKARAKKEEWAGAGWKLEQDNVLREFRQGITHGGGTRFKTATSERKLEKGMSGVEEAAVGAQLTTGSTKTKGNVCTPRPAGCSTIASTAERRSEAALPPVSDSLSAICDRRR